MMMYKKEITQVLLIFFTLLESVHSYSNELGPSYTNTSPCSTDADCPTGKGQVCWFQFDGCARGQCRCNANTHVMDNGVCHELKKEGDVCTSRDKCPHGMHCVENTCQCVHGQSRPDRLFCAHSKDKLLGESCDSKDTCFQKTDTSTYSAEGTECSYKGICRCQDGYKTDRFTCRKWYLGEHGCSQHYHCGGGALCINQVCRCPTGYHTAGTKCVKNGATYNLPQGASCDEIYERRYCGSGLLCHKCTPSAPYRCVRFSSLREGQHSHAVVTSTHNMSLLTTALIVFTCLSHQWLLR